MGSVCAAEDVLLSGAGVDDAAPAVAGAQPLLAQAGLGPLDASQYHLQRLLLPTSASTLAPCSLAADLCLLDLMRAMTSARALT